MPRVDQFPVASLLRGAAAKGLFGPLQILRQFDAHANPLAQLFPCNRNTRSLRIEQKRVRRAVRVQKSLFRAKRKARLELCVRVN